MFKKLAGTNTTRVFTLFKNDVLKNAAEWITLTSWAIPCFVALQARNLEIDAQTPIDLAPIDEMNTDFITLIGLIVSNCTKNMGILLSTPDIDLMRLAQLAENCGESARSLFNATYCEKVMKPLFTEYNANAQETEHALSKMTLACELLLSCSIIMRLYHQQTRLMLIKDLTLVASAGVLVYALVSTPETPGFLTQGPKEVCYYVGNEINDEIDTVLGTIKKTLDPYLALFPMPTTGKIPPSIPPLNITVAPDFASVFSIASIQNLIDEITAIRNALLASGSLLFSYIVLCTLENLVNNYNEHI